MKTAETLFNVNQTFPLRNMQDLDPLMDRIGEAKIVLLGEASHGTHEFYTFRSHLSQRLIREKNFNFVAVEGDWPDCYKINRYIKGYSDSGKSALEVLHSFNRWPTWMWANWEMVALTEWLKDYNHQLSTEHKVGFYGLDVYSLWESMHTMVNYLEKEDPEAAVIAKRALKCFEPYEEDGQFYATAIQRLPESCENKVLGLLKEIHKRAGMYDHDREAPLNMKLNALVSVNAEKYYRSMFSYDAESWNIRDTHMVETLERILNFHGQDCKAIIWEHNTHIGDARATNMSRSGMINVGQLLREHNREKDVVAVGFGTYAGTVIASEEWGAPMREMEVPEARDHSLENLLHSEYDENRLIITSKEDENPIFNKVQPHRAIGVVYNPDYEKYGNYVPSVLADRYDAFIFIDQTSALHPLHIKNAGSEMPETYPFGI